MKTRITKITAVALFALSILMGNVNAKGTEISASNYENIETTLDLEDWMINDSFWDTENNLIVNQESEASLELENWMTNENTWIVENKIDLKTETEQSLTFEPWMTNECIWNF
jgi:hypothetical protein